MSGISIDQAFAYALQHQMSGRQAEAQALYDDLLRQFPDQPVIRKAATLLAQPTQETAEILAELRGMIAPFYLPMPDCQVAGLAQLYEASFGRKRDGVFVEIGAYDGRSFSNTDFLASLGWRGLYVEPVPEFHARCAAWHRGNMRVTAENCAVGGEEREIEIHVGGTLSTGLAKQKAHYQSLDWGAGSFVESRIIRAPQHRLETLLSRHAIPRGFDLLVVDVEGMEREVLESFDLGQWLPKMAIIELEDQHPDFAHLPEVVERCRAVRELFARHGYREIQRDAINTVFGRETAHSPPALAEIGRMAGNERNRDAWVTAQLKDLPAGQRLLDVGAGQCRYKPHCGHLRYVAQDVAIYDGQGDGSGLHTGNWDFSRIDLVCDLLDIPEDQPFDAILCTEVLEHVPDPIRAIEKMARLLAPNGTLLLTAPFCALTHFAPHFHATGFSPFFYRHHLERLGLVIEEMTPNGDYFRTLAQELVRLPEILQKYLNAAPDEKMRRNITELAAQMIACSDRKQGSSELLAFGYHVRARRN